MPGSEEGVSCLRCRESRQVEGTAGSVAWEEVAWGGEHGEVGTVRWAWGGGQSLHGLP